jgi:hypothetical protein
MNRTRKFAATVGLGIALALTCTSPALAEECWENEQVHQHETYVPSDGVDYGNGTTCINSGGASASAVVFGSPGLLSGNNIQIPIYAPINICGNSVNLLGIG